MLKPDKKVHAPEKSVSVDIMNSNRFNARCIWFLLLGMICTIQAYASLSGGQNPAQSVASMRQLKAKPNQELIVLVHGLMRTSLSMWPLKHVLEKQGYQVYSYSYPSPKYTIRQHGAYLNRYIKKLLEKNPGMNINFITHSLGGIITREALSGLSPKELKHVACLIMLAPPNQGSELAKLTGKLFPLITNPIKPLAELSSDQNAYVHHVPVPNIRIGIIAGRYDAKVPPESARLEGQGRPVIVNSNHTFIMNNSETKKLILSFLKTGAFTPAKK